jgi:hypothetical protein
MPSAIGLARFLSSRRRSGITYLAELGKGIAPGRRRVFREDIGNGKGGKRRQERRNGGRQRLPQLPSG